MPDKSSHHHYENNPFFIASNGITLLANLANGVFVFLLVWSIVGLFSNSSSPNPSKSSFDNAVNVVNSWTINDWLLVLVSSLVIGLAFAMIVALLGGVSAYTSARLAQGKNVKLGTAFREAFDRLWSFLWLQSIICAKLILWSMLFIVPGIIMYFRYSLANVAFFDDRKNLRGNAAIKESLRLTKGGWITTFASNVLFNVLTLGAINSIVSTSVNAVLYKQFDQLDNKKKPDAHWLSWVTLVAPFALLGIAVLFLLVIVVVVGILDLKAR